MALLPLHDCVHSSSNILLIVSLYHPSSTRNLRLVDEFLRMFQLFRSIKRLILSLAFCNVALIFGDLLCYLSLLDHVQHLLIAILFMSLVNTLIHCGKPKRGLSIKTQ